MRSKWKGKFTDPRFDLSLIRPSALKRQNDLPSRNSTILAGFIHRKVSVPNGRMQSKFTVKPFMVGHKFGEFVHTKLMGRAIHERKRKKK